MRLAFAKSDDHTQSRSGGVGLVVGTG
jgi:hypothetical protein